MIVPHFDTMSTFAIRTTHTQRDNLIIALVMLGHKKPGELIDRAQTVANTIANAEAHNATPYVTSDIWRDQESFQKCLPAVWDYVTAGHRGGG